MDYIPPFNGDPEDIYINRNPSTGTPGSKVPAQIFNDIQAEILNVIVAAGLTPSDADLTQLTQAIMALANFNITGLTEQAAIDLLTDFIPFFDADAVDPENGDERKIKAGDLLSRFMGGRMSIAADANWNTLVTPGMYNTTGSGYSNGPLGASAHPGTLWIIGRSQSANHATQLFFYSAATPALWARTTTDGGATWTTWRNLAQRGVIIDRVYAENKAATAISGTIPIDDTIPQVSEGTEIISASITPKKSTNRIRARAAGFFGASNSNVNGTMAFFVNGAANAIFATYLKVEGTGDDTVAAMAEYEWEAGSTDAQTISVRAGKSTGSMIINGQTTARTYGGAAAFTLILEEIEV